MIYYWLRAFYIFFGGQFLWQKVNLADDLSRVRKVSMLDCEGLHYMNNSKYLFYMDLIRFEILFRTKLYNATLKKGVYPILGSQKIIYKKPLKMWSKFKITLKLEGWDDKWVYHRQVFEQKGEINAIGYTKVAFWKHNKTQDLHTILRESEINIPHKRPSKAVLEIFKNDYELLKNEER